MKRHLIFSSLILASSLYAQPQTSPARCCTFDKKGLSELLPPDAKTLIERINAKGRFRIDIMSEGEQLWVELADVSSRAQIKVRIDEGFSIASWKIAEHERLPQGLYVLYPQATVIRDGKFIRKGQPIDLDGLCQLRKVPGTPHTLEGIARYSPHWKDIKIGEDKGGVYIEASLAGWDYPGLSPTFGRSKMIRRYTLNDHSLTTDIAVFGEEGALADIGEHATVAFAPGKTTFKLPKVIGRFNLDQNKLPLSHRPMISENNRFDQPEPFKGIDDIFIVKADKEGQIIAELEDLKEGIVTRYTFSGSYGAPAGESAFVYVSSGSSTRSSKDYAVGVIGALSVGPDGPNRQNQLGGSIPLRHNDVRYARSVMTTYFKQNPQEDPDNNE